MNWAWPVNSRKAHFFVDGRSLCSKWAFFGKTGSAPADERDCCRACLRKLGKNTHGASNGAGGLAAPKTTEQRSHPESGTKEEPT